MRSKTRYIKWLVVALSLVAVLLLVGMCGLAFLYTRQLDQAGAAYAPPCEGFHGFFGRSRRSWERRKNVGQLPRLWSQATEHPE